MLHIPHPLVVVVPFSLYKSLEDSISLEKDKDTDSKMEPTKQKWKVAISSVLPEVADEFALSCVFSSNCMLMLKLHNLFCK